MATLFHDIKPWMQKCIIESQDSIEKKVVEKTEQMIQAVHQHLDALQLQVIARPELTIYFNHSLGGCVQFVSRCTQYFGDARF